MTRNVWYGLMALVLLASVEARACNVPVFRYALERWESDPYRLIVFSRGTGSSNEQRVLQLLKPYESGDIVTLPMYISKIDSGMPMDEWQTSLWDTVKTCEAPQALLLYPEALQVTQAIWQGTLTPERWKAIADSPARKEMERRLRSGDSAVWLLWDSDDKEETETARKTLETELRQLEKELELPAGFAEESGGAVTDVVIRFSVLPVSRKNPAEDILFRSLSGLSEQFAAATKPVVVPVFGRARALGMMSGDQLNATTLGDVCDFIVGPCACQVKAENPGFDLLVNGNWLDNLALHPIDDAVTGQFVQALADTTGVSRAFTVTNLPVDRLSKATRAANRAVLNMRHVTAMTVGGVMVVAAAATILIIIRSRNRN